MRSGRKTFWLPLIRLGAFFGGVVIAGNAFFHAARSEADSLPKDPDRSVDYFSRKKKRLERSFFRLLDRFLGVPASAATADQEAVAARVAGPIVDKLTTSEREKVVSPEPEAAPFVWPTPLAVHPLPRTMEFLEWHDFRAQLVTDLYRRCARDLPADVGDALLRGPEMLFDEITLAIGSPSGRPLVRSWKDEENRSVTGRMLDVQFDLRDQRIFSVFLQQWTERERRYLGGFDEESRASTYGFQDRTEGPDLHDVADDQRRILMDALRRTYLARYRMQSDEPFPDEVWECRNWNGFDFVALPVLISGVLYYRGINKRVSIGPTALRFTFEPASEFIRRRHDRAVMGALEWTVKGFPLGFIVSAGLHGGHYEMDFIGIGTSIGAARRAVENQYDDGRR
jgi:hypothetical protein